MPILSPATLVTGLMTVALCLFAVWIWQRSRECGVWYTDFGTHTGAERCRRPKSHTGDHHFTPIDADRKLHASRRRSSR